MGTVKIVGEPQTWWLVKSRWKMSIEPVKVSSYSDKRVTIVNDWGRGRTSETMAMKASDGVRYFPDENDAKTYAIAAATARLERLREEMGELEEFIAPLHRD